MGSAFTPRGFDGGTDGTGMVPPGTVWEPTDSPTSPPPGGGPPGVDVDTLKAGDREGRIVVPPGHRALRIRDHDTTFVYIATQEHLLQVIDRLRADFATP